jgi:PAS domain S-box-containing protein
MTEGLALHEIILNERGQAYDYRFLQVNPSFEKIMGLKSADITGKTVRQILPNVEQYWIDTYAKVALEGETLRINNFSSDLKKYFDVITFSPKKYYFAVLALDITEKVVMQRELIKAKEEAEAAWRAKNIFIANMSHELRNPMNGIMGFVDLLCESELNDSQREYVNIIHDSSFSLLRILNDIIDFSRLDSSAMSICEEMTDIRAYMSRIYEFFLPSCSLAGNSFVLETDSMIPRSIFMDKERYRQVISNLIGNAIKFCRNGKVEVKLSLISKTNEVCEINFSVKDSGIGIKEEDMHKLFRPFSQIDSTPAKKYSGTGLGLAISQRIIQAFGSEIKVDSLPGKGSIFHFIMKFKYKD